MGWAGADKKLNESVKPCLYTFSNVLENIFNISFSNKFNFISAPPLIAF